MVPKAILLYIYQTFAPLQKSFRCLFGSIFSSYKPWKTLHSIQTQVQKQQQQQQQPLPLTFNIDLDHNNNDNKKNKHNISDRSPEKWRTPWSSWTTREVYTVWVFTMALYCGRLRRGLLKQVVWVGASPTPRCSTPSMLLKLLGWFHHATPLGYLKHVLKYKTVLLVLEALLKCIRKLRAWLPKIVSLTLKEFYWKLQRRGRQSGSKQNGLHLQCFEWRDFPSRGFKGVFLEVKGSKKITI